MRKLCRLALVSLLVTAAACSRDPEVAKREFVQSGDTFLAQNKIQEAIIEYRNAVAVDARDGVTRLKLGDLYLRANQPQNALSEYVRAADLRPADVEAQLKAGRLLWLGGRYDDARSRADKALAIAPGNVQARVLRGNTLAGLRDLDAAVKEIETAIREDPAPAMSYANLATLHDAKGDVELAEKSFAQAVQADPKSVEARLAQAAFYWARRRDSDAENALKGALAIDPQNVMANRALAVFYQTSGRVPEAEAPLKRLADTSPDAAGPLALADYYLATGRTKDAKAILESVADRADAYGPARVKLAALAVVGGDRSAAHALLDQAIEKNKKDGDAWAAKAGLHRLEGKLDEALASARAAVETESNSANYQFELGNVLAAMKQPGDALKAYNEALRLNPRHVPAALAGARLHLAGGQLEDALQLAQSAARLAPQNPDALFMLARAQASSGNNAAAEVALNKLDPAHRNTAPAQAEWGRLLVARGQLAEARTAFERALAINPVSQVALEGLVTLDLRENKGAAARARAQRAAAAAPLDAQVQILAGRTHVTLKDFQLAEKYFKSAVAADPNSFSAYEALAQLYVAQNRLPEAMGEFQRLVDKNPKDAGSLTAVGVLQQMQKRDAEAKATYRKVLAVNPRAAVAANNLAWIQAEEGEDLDTALQLAQSAKAEMPEVAEVSDTLGWVYLKKRLAPLAIRAFEDAVKVDPNTAVYYYHLGLAYAEAKENERARRALIRATQLQLAPEYLADTNKLLAAMGPETK